MRTGGGTPPPPVMSIMMNALLLEDSQSTALIIRRALQTAGYHVIEHRGVFSASNLHRPVDLYVIDATVL